MAKTRYPAVAGFFYEREPSALRRRIEWCFKHKLGPGLPPQVEERGKRRIVGLVCPHAGYMYSGPVAAHSYSELARDGRPEVVIILGPNHTGLGSGISIVDSGYWRTPLGDVKVNDDVARRIVRNSELISVDELAHEQEHSIEVQLPFLQYIYGNNFTFVPICMMLQMRGACIDVGTAIAKAIKDENAVVIASTDFTHYEPYDRAYNNDGRVLKAIEALDPELMLKLVDSIPVSMCGPGPVAAMLYAVKQLSATKAAILKYATSGDVTGDMFSVVGYGSVKIEK
ncbi:MAG: AmmeMemoRadiSam system protein B [Candidatus Nezhaarchaeota archaeon]|nr:AmmeMemoRadiSam system protein B [Candidatus Nezhaarchaeota archaeon]MCX8141792.1 AmmeMemoRadiSam system protein B [Candidatus Nezhaarchaeota archaeon]MDW8050429.1 AmmeMemoRadiSam system protein B [Nitrososphaerota archaeon]